MSDIGNDAAAILAQRDALRVEVARLLATGMDMAARRLAAECMLVECKQSVGYAMRLKIDRLLQGDDTIEAMVDRGAAALVEGGVVCEPVTGDVLHDYDWTPYEAAEVVVRAALRAEVEDADVVPGSLAQRFKDERNIARRQSRRRAELLEIAHSEVVDQTERIEQLEQALMEIARTWPNAKRSGRRPSLSAEEAQRRADAALHPDQREAT